MAVLIWGTSRDLLARLEIGQDSAELSAQFEVRQDSAELLGNTIIRQPGSAELFSKAEVTHSIELLGKGKVQQPNTAEFLGKTEIQRPSSSELLGKCSIVHSTELLCNATIKNVGSAVLYARARVGQDSRELFAKFEAQDIQILYAKGIIRQADFGALYARAEVGQGSAELFAKAVVGQGSVELFGKGIVRNAASSDLKGTVDITHSIDLLVRAVIGHPALPVWLKAIFSMGLTNAYRDLGSIIELRQAALVELLGKAVIRHPDSEELLGKADIQQPGSAEHLGKAIIKNVGSAELLCGFAAQSFGDLKARMIIGPAKNSDVYISSYDPSDWINEVMGVGQGFIAIPWVEADTVVKTSGYSSARLTSASGPGQYKEIRFGWGGMNWGVEGLPDLVPTPIDTGGRGPRRGSRTARDKRREVPQSSYKDLAALFVTQPIKDLNASFYVMVNYTSWALVWTRDYGTGIILDGVYVDNSGNCYITDESYASVYFRSYAGVETSRSDYGYMIPRRESLPTAFSEGGQRYVLGENELIFDQFDIWRDGAIVASINPVTDLGADFDQFLSVTMSSSGKYIAFVVEGLSNKYYVMLYEGT